MQSAVSKVVTRFTIVLGVAVLCAGLAFSSQAQTATPASQEGAVAATSAQMCPSPAPVPPRVDPVSGKMCHPSSCTPSFCSRGDIAPLGSHPATRPLQDRLVTLDCSPHSVTPLQVFAEADPATRKSRLFMYYLLDSTGFQPSVFTTSI